MQIYGILHVEETRYLICKLKNGKFYCKCEGPSGEKWREYNFDIFPEEVKQKINTLQALGQHN